MTETRGKTICLQPLLRPAVEACYVRIYPQGSAAWTSTSAQAARTTATRTLRALTRQGTTLASATWGTQATAHFHPPFPSDPWHYLLLLTLRTVSDPHVDTHIPLQEWGPGFVHGQGVKQIILSDVRKHQRRQPSWRDGQ
eukprot:3715360-Rhodomonas_salina.1